MHMHMSLCHTWHMQIAATSQKASERVVVLLRPTEKQRLERLAKAHHVSSAEILRRSLRAYEGQDESAEEAVIVQMNAVLDGMLESLRTTRAKVQQNLANIEKHKRVAL